MAKIKGTFCEEKLAYKRYFDRRSFRWKKSGRAWVLVGCKRGAWNDTRKQCLIGTEAYVLLRSTTANVRCPAGSRRVSK